jgi:hypothetical protein
MVRPALLGIVTVLLLACGSSDSTGSDPTPAAADGGAQGDASGPGAQDAAGGADSATPAPTTNDFATTLYTAILVEGRRELAAPASSVTWSAFVNVYDLKTTQLITDAVVKIGLPGELHLLMVQGTRYALPDFATGDIPEFEVSVERGKASLHDAHLPSPGIHSFSWTNAAEGAGSVKQTVTWTPSGNAAVKVNLVGAADPIAGIADTGSRVWTELGSPTTGTTPVQVVRLADKAIAPRSSAQVIVRVLSKI